MTKEREARALKTALLLAGVIAQGCSPARAPAEVAQPAPTASPPQARGSSPPSEPASSIPGDAGAATDSAPAPDRADGKDGRISQRTRDGSQEDGVLV